MKKAVYKLKKGIKERIAEICDMPKDIVMDLPRLVFLGNRELQINNYKGLLEYSTEVIRIATNNKQIIINGEDLHITRLLADTVFIGGKFSTVNFSSKRNIEKII